MQQSDNVTNAVESLADTLLLAALRRAQEKAQVLAETGSAAGRLADVSGALGVFQSHLEAIPESLRPKLVGLVGVNGEAPSKIASLALETALAVGLGAEADAMSAATQASIDLGEAEKKTRRAKKE